MLPYAHFIFQMYLLFIYSIRKWETNMFRLYFGRLNEFVCVCFFLVEKVLSPCLLLPSILDFVLQEDVKGFSFNPGALNSIYIHTNTFFFLEANSIYMTSWPALDSMLVDIWFLDQINKFKHLKCEDKQIHILTGAKNNINFIQKYKE